MAAFASEIGGITLPKPIDGAASTSEHALPREHEQVACQSGGVGNAQKNEWLTIRTG
jgi:hypothetical protein